MTSDGLKPAYAMGINRAFVALERITSNVARMTSYGNACGFGSGRSNFGTSETGFRARFPSSVVGTPSDALGLRCLPAVSLRRNYSKGTFAKLGPGAHQARSEDGRQLLPTPHPDGVSHLCHTSAVPLRVLS